MRTSGKKKREDTCVVAHAGDLGNLWQEKSHEFEGNLGYTVKSKRLTTEKPSLKKKKKVKKKTPERMVSKTPTGAGAGAGQ